MKLRPLIPLLSALCLLVGVGCSDYVSVHGTVVFPDGKPLQQGMVCFQSEKFVGRGEIQNDGTYKLGLQKPGEGIPPDSYVVYISGAVDIEALPLTQGREIAKIPKETPLIDPKFFGPETSDLSCTVEKSMKLPYNITVEYPN